MANTKRPRTGERRQINQPLKIDKLPPEIHEAVLTLRNRLGKTWEEIEALSAAPKDKGGFVDWENLPLGKIICVASLVGCYHAETLTPSRLESHWGDFSIGRFAFKLENVRVLKTP